MLKAISSYFRRWNLTTLKPFGVCPSDAVRLSIGDHKVDLCKALASSFGDVAAVEIVCGNLLDLSCDGIVSPANSFGDMGGGIDKAIDDFHGGEAQRRVMAAIREQYYGELPVGAALIVELPTARFPFVIAAPTMRVPGSVKGSLNAYLAMRGALVAVSKHNESGNCRIRSLAISGLGTGIGGMDFEEAAGQMRVAYDTIIGGKWRQIDQTALAPFAFLDGR